MPAPRGGERIRDEEARPDVYLTLVILTFLTTLIATIIMFVEYKVVT